MSIIRKISSYLLAVFNILIVMIPLFLTMQWIFISLKTTDVSNVINFFGMLEKTIQTPEGYVNLSTISWTPLLKLLGFCADLMGTLPFLISLFLLKKLFVHYRDGEIFTKSNAILYRKLGVLYLIDALFIKSLSQMLMILAVTMTNPPGSRYLSISFGTPNLSSLFYGVLVIVISWVMLEASKLHDEHKFTI
jgi:hypothetical protein